MKIGVFGEAKKNGETLVFYVDASDYESYIKKQQFDCITKVKIEFVIDNCFDILKMQHPETIVNAIYKVLAEGALLSN